MNERRLGTSLSLTMKPELLSSFFLLLQQGVGVTAYVGCTLDKLLERQWYIDPSYVASRVSTIFVDSRAVDDIKTAVVRDGSVVALSGAMPGLVGATMRRGGHLGQMRGAMTYTDTADGGPDRIGAVKIKLFNLLLPELGPLFLGRGILVDCGSLRSLIAGVDATFWAGCRHIAVNGSPAPAESVAVGDWIPAEGTVRLTVLFEE